MKLSLSSLQVYLRPIQALSQAHFHTLSHALFHLVLNTYPLSLGSCRSQQFKREEAVKCEMLQVVSVVSRRGLGSREWTEE